MKVFVRNPVPVTERGPMSPARRKRILTRQNGVCAYPECEVSEGLEVDHIVCLGLGGKDVDDNLEALCPDCHRRKTNLDLKLIAKARHQRAFHEGARPKPVRQLRGRGFGKSRREGDPAYD